MLSASVNGQVKLSDESKISVLTCAQGEELYSKFGHSALRVCDPKNNIDWVFNYGTFNFRTPNFYLKFANGKLNYILSVGEFKSFLPEYFEENRKVTEQTLNIGQHDRQRVFEALKENYKPENRYYKYDFFYDNCATRIADVISDNIEGGVVMEEVPVENGKGSFRSYLHYYLVSSPWTETGLNMILGLPADKIASRRESTFLPDFLMEACDGAYIQSLDGNRVPLVRNKQELLTFDKDPAETRFWKGPFMVFSVLLLAVILLSARAKSKVSIVFDRLLFFVAGTVGLLICYLWFVTDHSVTGYNFNVLWSFPTFLYLSLAPAKTKVYRLVLLLNMAGVALFIVGWKLIPQAFPLATIPIALLIGYRLFSRYRRLE